ncbi:hypothetical protein GCM10010498_65890 [Streptomyces cavourensis]|nr:hypothetical protein GCM10010498_65890 [Streptomyces cavourensis]
MFRVCQRAFIVRARGRLMGVVTVLGALPSSRGMLEVRWSGIWFTIPVVAERAVNAQTVC